MKAKQIRTLAVIVSLAIIASLGCTSHAAPSDEGKWLGKYEQQNKDKMILVLQADHKGTMGPAGQAGDITWEIAGDDKIIVHMGVEGNFFMTKDGNLRDDEGTTWLKKP